jgi:hypothetical protein
VAWKAKAHTASHYLVDWGYVGGAGVTLFITTAGVLSVSANYGTNTARTVNTHDVHSGSLRIAVQERRQRD